MSFVQFHRAIAVLTIVAAALASTSTTQAAPLAKGTAFPLSDGAAPTLFVVEIHRVTSDNTIDLAVVLTAPKPLPKSQAELLMQLGELCLRYQAEIVKAAVPAAERERMNVFVPLYRVPAPGKSNQFGDQGFAFSIRDGRCSLEAPFPAELKDKTLKRATQSVGN